LRVENLKLPLRTQTNEPSPVGRIFLQNWETVLNFFKTVSQSFFEGFEFSSFAP
jgi:hypothetical protein